MKRLSGTLNRYEKERDEKDEMFDEIWQLFSFLLLVNASGDWSLYAIYRMRHSVDVVERNERENQANKPINQTHQHIKLSNYLKVKIELKNILPSGGSNSVHHCAGKH